MKKSAIFIIMKKELDRFFGDRRMVLTTVLLPGLMIYLLYSIMGSAISSQYTVDDTYTPTIAVANMPESIDSLATAAGLQLTESTPSASGDAQADVSDQMLDLYVVFPENFDADVAAYSTDSGAPAPNVEIYYNSVSASSEAAYQSIVGLLDAYESSMANKFDINRDGTYDLASEQDASGSIFSSMLPMLLMIFMFSGCMAIAPESIAGEKERGTIAPLLITPTRRSDIAIGKIIALSIISLISGISSAIGTILALPKLMSGAGDLDTSFYTMKDYLLLGVVIISTILLLVTLISVISAFAKTVKEASTYVSPLMVLVMLIGVTAMFGGAAKENLVFYLIPLYNSVQCMIGILSFQSISSHILLTAAANLFYTGLGVFLLTRMFHNERIMFSK